MKLFKKISNKKSLFIVFSTAIFFISFISYFAVQTSAQNIIVKPIEKSVVAPVQIKQDALISGIPVNIKIPKIKVMLLLKTWDLQ